MVKLWARKRGIYSNIYGYLGGISWSILVAQTCISFPNFEVNRLFYMFFYLFSVWKWPQPVILTSIDVPEYDDIKLGVNIWNPNLNQDDCGHLMPIITPSFPQFNTSVNVTKTTLRIIKKEFKRTYVTLKKRTTDFEGTIKELYMPFKITLEYNLYLKLELMADDPINFHRWVG